MILSAFMGSIKFSVDRCDEWCMAATVGDEDKARFYLTFATLIVPITAIHCGEFHQSRELKLGQCRQVSGKYFLKEGFNHLISVFLNMILIATITPLPEHLHVTSLIIQCHVTFQTSARYLSLQVKPWLTPATAIMAFL